MSTTKAMGLCRAVILVGLAWGLVAGGCSDTKGRHADKKLLQEVEIAQRLYARAVSLMASTPVKVDGQYAPLFPASRIGEGSIVELPPPLAVHPGAWEDLVKAEKGLLRALGEYGQAAGPEEQALAQTMLGDILTLKAKYQLASSAADRQEARDTVALANRAVSMVWLYTGLVKYCNQLMALGNKDVLEMLAAAQQEAVKVKEAAAKVQAEVQSLRVQRDQLHAANEKLIPQVRRLRLDGEQADGPRRMELLEQSLKVEAEINAKVSAIAALENAIEVQQTALNDLSLEIRTAEGRQKTAEAIIEARRNYADTGSKGLEAIQAALVKATGEVQGQITRLARVCERLAGAQDVAAEAYSQAVSKYETARRLRSRGQDLQTTARLADAHWLLAALKGQSLDLRRRNILLLERLAAIGSAGSPGAPGQTRSTARESDWPVELSESAQQAVPPFARGVLAYVPDPQQVRKDAVENYQQAGDLYDTAARGAPSALRWVYQGQAAAAYVALYRLSPDAEVLAKAREALSQALEDKRESSYLVAVVELEKLLQSSLPQPAKESKAPPKEPSALPQEPSAAPPGPDAAPE